MQPELLPPLEDELGFVNFGFKIDFLIWEPIARLNLQRIAKIWLLPRGEHVREMCSEDVSRRTLSH